MSGVEPAATRGSPQRPGSVVVALLRGVFWNADERRLRAAWRVVGQQATLIGSYFLLGWLLRETGLRPPSGSSGYFVTLGLMRLALAIGCVWLAARVLDRRRLVEYGLRFDRDWVADLVFGLALGAGMMSLVFLTGRGAGWVVVTGYFRTRSPEVAFPVAILTPLTLFVCVGIAEELIFRGYVLRNLAEGLTVRALGGPRMGLVWACLLSSAIFGLLHGGNPNATLVSTLSVSLAGVFLALGYLLTGRLGLPIGLHVTWNFFQGNVFGFPVSGVTLLPTSLVATEQVGPVVWTGGAFGPEAGLLGLGAMLVGSVATLGWVRWRQGGLGLATGLVRPPERGKPQTLDAPAD